jgi:hypothetical protein
VCHYQARLAWILQPPLLGHGHIALTWYYRASPLGLSAISKLLHGVRHGVPAVLDFSVLLCPFCLSLHRYQGHTGFEAVCAVSFVSMSLEFGIHRGSPVT